MSAIAGIFADRFDASHRLCGQMLVSQRIYGPDQESVGSLGNATFGRCLFRLLHEDAFDRQPVIGCDGTAMLVADVRLDNRDELIAQAAKAAQARTWSDSRLLMQAYETWGIGLLDHVVGDFAFAIWDRRVNQLYLARDPTGQRPLHYRTSSNRLDFASMPIGLLANASDWSPVRGAKIGEFVQQAPASRTTSYFENIFKVPPGHYVAFSDGVSTTRQYWRPLPKPLRLARDEDYVDAFNEQLERSVKARLRDAGPLVGSQLSSGRDSSAVTAIAARLLAPAGARVLAATGAPRVGFAGTAPHRKIMDESRIAARTAAMYSNIDHLIVRADRSFDFNDYANLWGYYQEPLFNACNFPWLAGINRKLAEAGATVCLTGDLGNLTISAGGYATLPDFLWQGSWQAWLREFRTLTATGKMRRRGALAASAGGYLPRRLWTLLAKATGRSEDAQRPLVRAAWQPIDPDRFTWAQPPRNTYRDRIEKILNTSIAGIRKGNLAQFGIDERDPTSDRRLIEFCLSLPADQLVKNGVERPLFSRAMKGLIAPEVIAGEQRGLQAGDWYDSYTRSGLQNAVSAIAADPRVAAIIDVEALAALVDGWPETPIRSPDDVSAFRIPLMRTLSAAYFIRSSGVEPPHRA
ncbi:asparagine synthetase B family protein [Sphingomonas sp. MMS24-J45]|uniref:asparagine synthetase B family protein n=1 Tax=Sphingomonas sp. MMS24-J45 TaxID=3238806 RepID=UPI00384FE79B